MANLAKFTINATASNPGGFDATISQALTFLLEGGPASLVNRWTLQVFDAADATSPAASKSAPTITLVGSTSGQKVDAATPASSITTAMPGSGVHSWIVRSIVNGGLDAKGKASSDYVYERMISIKTGSGLRKVVYAEATQYGARGWADAQNDLIDAGAGPLTAPGGAADANKVAAASGAGTNLQYAAAIKLGSSGTALEFGTTPSTVGYLRMPNNTGSPAVSVRGAGAYNVTMVGGVDSGDIGRFGDNTNMVNMYFDVKASGRYGFWIGGTEEVEVGDTFFDIKNNNLLNIGDLDHNGTNLGVFGTAPTTKKTVTGAKGSNAALGSLMTALAAYGLVTDSTTA